MTAAEPIHFLTTTEVSARRSRSTAGERPLVAGQRSCDTPGLMGVYGLMLMPVVRHDRAVGPCHYMAIRATFTGRKLRQEYANE